MGFLNITKTCFKFEAFTRNINLMNTMIQVVEKQYFVYQIDVFIL